MMDKKKFYITTPIYYVNDIPHIGHAYTTIAADIMSRHYRSEGREVFFLTGTDEHGQKVEKAAAEKGLSPQKHSDVMVENFKTLWKKLNISNDAFIRTTDEAHIKTVQGLMQILWDKGEIEKRQYAGWYCTPDERFWTEKDLVDGNCPDCGRPVDQIQEENYFFLMSKYQNRLIKHIDDNPSFILPDTRRNEVLGFLKNNTLGDLCISRPKSRLSWGIQLPFDANFVTYVWFDALVNYFSATKYLVAGSNELPVTGNELKGQAHQSSLVARHSSLDFWPATHHLIGKDILTTHSVYWSTMLMALNFPLPDNIFAHGWWTVQGKKMSKSIGNVVDPNEMVDKYGVDAFRYFLFREVTFGLDGDFSEEALVGRINTDLANDLGNLLSRFLTMAEKYFNGAVDPPVLPAAVQDPIEAHKRLCDDAKTSSQDERYWTHLNFNLILERIWIMVSESNNLIAKTEPWKLFKNDKDSVKSVMMNLWNALRLTAVSLYPFMPETADRIWNQIGLADSITSSQFPDVFSWDWRPSHQIKVSKGDPLFPRIEVKKETQTQKVNTPSSPAFSKEGLGGFEGDNLISIDDFAKVKLKIGKVVQAELVPKSRKLIRLQVDTGEMRQVVAGIGSHYSPDQLIGSKIVVVTNLQPAKLMGVESQGMLLAATDSDGVLSILIPAKDVKEGAMIK